MLLKYQTLYRLDPSVNAVNWNAPPFPQGPAPVLLNENPPESSQNKNFRLPIDSIVWDLSSAIRNPS